jgi:hypothetical protein
MGTFLSTMRKSTVRQINSLFFWLSAGNIATTRMSFTISTWLKLWGMWRRRGWRGDWRQRYKRKRWD